MKGFLKKCELQTDRHTDIQSHRVMNKVVHRGASLLKKIYMINANNN